MTTTTVASTPEIVDKARAALAEDSNALIERTEHVGMIWRCAAAGVHPFFLGVPGVAKSMMLRLLNGHFPDARYYEQQVFKDTKTEAFFGLYSIPQMEKERYVRVTRGTLAEAHFAFADEVFDGSAGLLNTLRPILAEGMFYNPDPQSIPLRMLAGAGNYLPAPDREDLQALLDRFGVIMNVRPIRSDDGFKAMLKGQVDRRRLKTQTGARNAKPEDWAQMTVIKLGEWDRVMEAVHNVEVGDDTLDAFVGLRRACDEAGISATISARRWGEIMKLAQTEALFSGRTTTLPEDLRIARHSLWKDPANEKLAYELTLPYLSKFEQRVGELQDEYEEQGQAVATFRDQARAGESYDTSAAMDTNKKLHKIKDRASSVRKDGADEGRDLRTLEELLDRIYGDRLWICTEVLGIGDVPDGRE